MYVAFKILVNLTMFIKIYANYKLFEAIRASKAEIFIN